MEMDSFKALKKNRINIRKDSPIELPEISNDLRWIQSLPKSFFSSREYEKDIISLQPRGGLSTASKQIDLWRLLKSSGADILPLTIDSNTRQNDYKKSSELYSKALKTNKDLLNGYPLLSIPIEQTREIIQEMKSPISLRHGTPDARLIAEAALSSGIMEIEGGAISYNLPYSKNYPLDMCFANWKYVDNLCAYYNSIGVPVVRESFGPLTSTLIPPVIILLIQILELDLALKEGVKFFSVSITQTGNLSQDIASSLALKTLTNWLKSYRSLNNNVKTYQVYHQWMGAFPIKRSLADQLLTYSTIAGILCKSDKIILKTRDEALGIPSVEANSDAVLSAKYCRDKFCLNGLNLSSEYIEIEKQFLVDEVKSLYKLIFSNSLFTKEESIVLAIKKGIIDVPFSPHISNNGLLNARRARDGSIRVVYKGNVPLSQSFLKHEEEIYNHKGDEDLDNVVKMILHFASKEDLI